MDTEKAISCAKLAKVRYSIPYPMVPGALFDLKRDELLDVPGRLILPAGEEILLK